MTGHDEERRIFTHLRLWMNIKKLKKFQNMKITYYNDNSKFEKRKIM